MLDLVGVHCRVGQPDDPLLPREIRADQECLLGVEIVRNVVIGDVRLDLGDEVPVDHALFDIDMEHRDVVGRVDDHGAADGGAPVRLILRALGADLALGEIIGNAVAERHVVVIQKGLEALRRRVRRREGAGLENLGLVRRSAIGEIDGDRLQVDGREIGDRAGLDVEHLEERVVQIDLADVLGFVGLLH